MTQTRLPGQLIRSGSIPTAALGGGVISASAQLATLLPVGTVSSSTQIDYNSITNKLNDVVSSSAQVTVLLPVGTVSSSIQINTGSFTGTLLGTASNATSASYALSASFAPGGTTFPYTGTAVISGSLIVTGSVGIGTATPSASLHVSGTTMVEQIIEKVNVTGSAPPTTFNIDLTSGSIFFRSASTAANWTANFRGNTTTTLNSMMYNGQSITATVLVLNGATAYSASAYQIDGASIIPRWQGGTSGSANANSLDAHQFTIIKVASASYVMLGSITKYT